MIVHLLALLMMTIGLVVGAGLSIAILVVWLCVILPDRTARPVADHIRSHAAALFLLAIGLLTFGGYALLLARTVMSA